MRVLVGLLLCASPVSANSYVYECRGEPAYLGASIDKSGRPCKLVTVPRDHAGEFRKIESEAGKQHKARRAKERWEQFLEQHGE